MYAHAHEQTLTATAAVTVALDREGRLATALFRINIPKPPPNRPATTVQQLHSTNKKGALLALVLSVAVHSMRMFFVSVEIFDTSPLMIGGLKFAHHKHVATTHTISTWRQRTP
jgi:hypothetical protein